MAKWSGEPWQRDIVLRDTLQARCLVSYLSNLLYPEEMYAARREERFFENGGEFARRIAGAAAEIVEAGDRLLGPPQIKRGDNGD